MLISSHIEWQHYAGRGGGDAWILLSRFKLEKVHYKIIKFKVLVLPDIFSGSSVVTFNKQKNTSKTFWHLEYLCLKRLILLKRWNITSCCCFLLSKFPCSTHKFQKKIAFRFKIPNHTWLIRINILLLHYGDWRALESGQDYSLQLSLYSRRGGGKLSYKPSPEGRVDYDISLSHWNARASIGHYFYAQKIELNCQIFFLPWHNNMKCDGWWLIHF